MQILELSYSWYEEYSPRLFYNEIGTISQEYWQGLCNDAINEAAQKLVQESTYQLDHPESIGEEDRGPGWIGLDSLVEEACKIVEAKGYVRCHPLKAEYFGSCIIKDTHDTEGMTYMKPEILQSVVDYNKRFDKKSREETDKYLAELEEENGD